MIAMRMDTPLVTAGDAEQVRLVVWDLDETFWHGTVSEGGIRAYIQANHDAVIELARRGIMSSICSKNDAATVLPILAARGVLDYFIFPSIDWSPKGGRLSALIETIGLRPASVMFIDDNAANRAEAQAVLPALQVEDERFPARMLWDPRFRGQDDRQFSRLAQYKVLERRARDAAAAGGSNLDFLRDCGIEIFVETDVDAHLDRAIELINRTNQLNFTKARLPEDATQARAELRALLARYDIQAGLLHVRDKYGDYGFCGFYALENAGFAKRLLHFCFSCRIADMGVEQFIYAKIGAPALHVRGPVAGAVRPDAAAPDWIVLRGEAPGSAAPSAAPVARAILRGGCNLAPIEHYLRFAASDLVGEFNVSRHGLDMRRDHSVFLRYALDGVDDAARARLAAMGFLPEDYDSALLRPAAGPGVWVLSFWADADFPLYRHRASGLKLPVSLHFPGRPADLTQVRQEDLPAHLRGGWASEAIRLLHDEYEFAGLTPAAEFAATLRDVLDRAGPGIRVFVIGHNEINPHAPAEHRFMWWKAEANQQTKAILADYPRVRWIDVQAFIERPEEVCEDPNHFSRLVYRRVAEYIIREIGVEEKERKNVLF